jgi:hypothetical protein
MEPITLCKVPLGDKMYLVIYIGQGSWIEPLPKLLNVPNHYTSNGPNFLAWPKKLLLCFMLSSPCI